MWLFIAILIAIVLYLIIIGSNQSREVDKECNQVSIGISKMDKELTEAKIERDELKELRKEEVHNNTVLLENNREQTQLLTKIADMTVTYIVGHEKETLGKIKELTRPYQSKLVPKN